MDQVPYRILLQAGFDENADLNHDGKIDNADVDILSEMWDDSSGGVRDQTYYFHFDATGSVIALSDSAGNTAEMYRYDVYGQFAVFAPDGQSRTASLCSNPYLFTGRRWDEETALYYYRARMYNPQIGRFCQTDPIGYADGINWYAYCGNNPIMLVDPYGLDWMDAASNFCAGVGDSLSFGLTGLVRKAIRVDDVVSRSSTSYIVGEYTEVAAEIALTAGSAVLKTAAKKAAMKAAREVAEKTGKEVVQSVGQEIVRRKGIKYMGKAPGKIRHHANPLFGQMRSIGGGTLFPTGGLPPALHSGRFNITIVGSYAEHMAAHRRLKLLDDIASVVVNPLTTSLRAANATNNMLGSDKRK